MKKLAAGLTLICLLVAKTTLAATEPACPPVQVSSGWSQFFYTSKIINGFVYDLDAAKLYTIFFSNRFNTFLPVPISAAQQLVYTKTPDTTYEKNIHHVYHQALEAENCTALTTESGVYLVVH